MPRDSAGNYTLPPGNPVIQGTLIEPSWANPTMFDIGAELGNSLDRYGRGGMLAPFKFFDGDIVAPAITFTNETTSGIYRAGAGDVRMGIQNRDAVRWRNDTTNPVGQKRPLQFWDGLAWVTIGVGDGTEFNPHAPGPLGDITPDVAFFTQASGTLPPIAPEHLTRMDYVDGKFQEAIDEINEIGSNTLNIYTDATPPVLLMSDSDGGALVTTLPLSTPELWLAVRNQNNSTPANALVQLDSLGLVPIELLPFSAIEVLGFWNPPVDGDTMPDGDTTGQTVIFNGDGNVNLKLTGDVYPQAYALTAVTAGDRAMWIEEDAPRYSEGWYYWPSTNSTFLPATNVTYDNTSTPLFTGPNVQEVLEEVDAQFARLTGATFSGNVNINPPPATSAVFTQNTDGGGLAILTDFNGLVRFDQLAVGGANEKNWVRLRRNGEVELSFNGTVKFETLADGARIDGQATATAPVPISISHLTRKDYVNLEDNIVRGEFAAVDAVLEGWINDNTAAIAINTADILLKADGANTLNIYTDATPPVLLMAATDGGALVTSLPLSSPETWLAVRTQNNSSPSDALVQLNASGLIPFSLLPFSGLDVLGFWNPVLDGANLPAGTTSGQVYVFNADGGVNLKNADDPFPQPTATIPVEAGDRALWLQGVAGYEDGWYFWAATNFNFLPASNITFDNAGTGFSAGNVQLVLEEVDLDFARTSYVDAADLVLQGFIDTNAGNIATNVADIAANLGLINTNIADIAALSGQLGDYLPLTGGTLSGNLKVNIAADSEVQFDLINTIGGVRSIVGSGTGEYRLRQTTATGAYEKEWVVGRRDAQVELYYAGAKKFETTADGTLAIGGVQVGVASGNHALLLGNELQLNRAGGSYISNYGLDAVGGSLIFRTTPDGGAIQNVLTMNSSGASSFAFSVSGVTPTNAAHLTRKDYVDANSGMGNSVELWRGALTATPVALSEDITNFSMILITSRDAGNFYSVSMFDPHDSDFTAATPYKVTRGTASATYEFPTMTSIASPNQDSLSIERVAGIK